MPTEPPGVGVPLTPPFPGHRYRSSGRTSSAESVSVSPGCTIHVCVDRRPCWFLHEKEDNDDDEDHDHGDAPDYNPSGPVAHLCIVRLRHSVTRWEGAWRRTATRGDSGTA